MDLLVTETKQANFELEDGRVLGIRVMQDDNGEEIYCCLKQKGKYTKEIIGLIFIKWNGNQRSLKKRS